MTFSFFYSHSCPATTSKSFALVECMLSDITDGMVYSILNVLNNLIMVRTVSKNICLN